MSSLTVSIEHQATVVHSLSEPVEVGDLTGLLAALKSAKTKTNEFLTELVEAEKTASKSVQPEVKIVAKTGKVYE